MPVWGKFHLWKISPRTIYVYLPPGYEKSNASYPVLYMHDGQNLFDPSRSYSGKTWKAEETLDKLIRIKKIKPVIVIGIDNTDDRINEYTPDPDINWPNAGGAKTYLDWIKNEVKPAIDKNFRTLRTSSSTAIAGSSLGGLVSLYAGIEYGDTFGTVAAFSPSLWWNERSIFNYFRNSKKLPEKIYIDYGSAEKDHGNSFLDFVQLLSQLGYSKDDNFVYQLQLNGEHSEEYWAERFPDALKFLFPTSF